MNSSHADDGIHTPEKGSTEREQLLDAARAPVQKKLGRDDVRFEVEQIRAGDGWAFVYVRMLNADGSVIDYAGTPLADAAKQGYVSPDYVALLQQADGEWQLRADAIGPTDMVWLAWPEKYGVEHELFED
ncbi:MAG TPA: hypothetical protein VIR05_02675 [Luteimonas sp.]